mgnify:CR=1 FL=1
MFDHLAKGRFIFGIGSGEALNEHILGDRWPPAPIRIQMMEEAVEAIRSAAKGDFEFLQRCRGLFEFQQQVGQLLARGEKRSGSHRMFVRRII